MGRVQFSGVNFSDLFSAKFLRRLHWEIRRKWYCNK
jgi:hypothetical protein